MKKIFTEISWEKPLYLCFNKLFICASSVLNAIKNIQVLKKILVNLFLVNI